MFSPEKIDEWIKEVDKRPESAALIIQFIANRLRDLNEWNEKLRTENLELRTGLRAEEYERQITHLEYQLELLRRRFGGDLSDTPIPTADSPPAENTSLLIYDSSGKVLRLEVDLATLHDGETIGVLGGISAIENPPRLLTVPVREELLFIFASGRIASLPLTAIPIFQSKDELLHWDRAHIPQEPQARDSLACIVPVSKMALADFFVQVSRRGFMKKIRKALLPSIMENKYIGTGVKHSSDETLDLVLSKNGSHFVLVSQQGYLQYIPETMLPYAIVEAMRLGKTDHLVAVFEAAEDKSILVMTQIGKTIHRTSDGLEIASDLQRKGHMLYSKSRRDQGVRVVGADSVDENDWGVAFHENGQITLHNIGEALNRGIIPIEGELLTFEILSVT